MNPFLLMEREEWIKNRASWSTWYNSQSDGTGAPTTKSDALLLPQSRHKRLFSHLSIGFYCFKYVTFSSVVSHNEDVSSLITIYLVTLGWLDLQFAVFPWLKSILHIFSSFISCFINAEPLWWNLSGYFWSCSYSVLSCNIFSRFSINKYIGRICWKRFSSNVIYSSWSIRMSSVKSDSSDIDIPLKDDLCSTLILTLFNKTLILFLP